jgi:hypothetical protein
LKVIFGDLLHRHIERWFFIEKGSQSKNYDFIDRDMDRKQTEIFWDSMSNPAFFVTVKPMTPHLSLETFEHHMDNAIKEFSYQMFGKKWKMHRMPKWFLIPEKNSCKTSGSRYELLHYHGKLCIDSKELKTKYQYHFNYFFYKHMLKARESVGVKRTKLLDVPAIEFAEWEEGKNGRGYSLKGLGKEFNGNDCYFNGKDERTFREAM